MLTEERINDFCNQKNYDIRLSGNGRWIDQKCAADVLTVVADCIMNYGLEHDDDFFCTRDVWHYTYTVENVEAVFRKPGVENPNAEHEYDKFFAQPMEMLAYAGVLNKRKQGKANFYQIANYDVLEYIALRERNALSFLKIYIQKVLNDSGIYDLFDTFFARQDKDSYDDVKDGFSQFTIQYTKINGEVECNRIFIKVLNPLAYYYHSRGTEKGRLSEHPITYDMLMYNRNNFRDVFSNKPKGVTRREYAAAHPIEINEAYYRYQSAKAKRFLRMFNDQNRQGKTEHMDGIHIFDQAVHMHHIFPESDYPEICYYLENLIALTPTQHLNYAHPNGNTREIDEQYQHLLLLSKADRIKENLTTPTAEKIYEFSNLLYVMNVGFDDDDIHDILDMDFGSVVNAINVHYSA